MIGIDSEGMVSSWNKGAQRLYGYTAQETIGQSISLLIPSDHIHDCSSIKDTVKNGGVVRHYETNRQRKDGTSVAVSLTASPIFGANGVVIGISSIERDITESKSQREVLRKTVERFRLAVHAGRMFAYEWDPATDMVLRSAESSHILGIDESMQITGRHAMASIHPLDREEVHAALAALRPENPYLKVSCRVLLKNSSPVWIEQCSIAHFDPQGRITRLVGMAADITERKQAEEALALAKSALIAAQEQERKRIARELHDDIGQRLALFIVELEQLVPNAPDFKTEAQQYLSVLAQQAKEIATDIQSLSHELHSAKLEHLGISVAVRGFCRDFSRNQQVDINCEVADLPAEVEPGIALCLFRVLQEALQNSLKHSGVRQFEVRLWATTDYIHLTIGDSGTGFDSGKSRQRQGLGLVSMEERVKLVQGKFSIESHADRGTTVHVRVPLFAENARRAAG